MKHRLDSTRKAPVAAMRESVRPEHEAKLQALRATIEASVTEGGVYSDDEVAEAIAAKAAAFIGKGHPAGRSTPDDDANRCR